MGHDHSHHHSHHHVGPKSIGLRFAVGIGLNVVFVVIEVAYGLIAGSTALLADAAHNLADVMGLVLAWGATVLARRPPSSRRTFGLRKSTVLAALTNAILIVLAIGGVAWEAIERLFDPTPVDGLVVIWVAAIAVVINGVSALMFTGTRDLNLRGAFLHLATDAGISAAVLLGGVVILATGAAWVDPAASLLVCAAVLLATWSLLRDALGLALDAVPAHIDTDAVEDYLSSLECVLEVHDLHIWALSTNEVALTAHVVTQDGAVPRNFYVDLARELSSRWGIGHATVQVEAHDAPDPCGQAPADVV
jgi:cobalt-zinc-cadmium efflux system protein